VLKVRNELCVRYAGEESARKAMYGGTFAKERRPIDTAPGDT